MKKELNKKSDEVTVIVEVALKGKIEDVKKYIRDEHSNVWEELGNKILGSPINIRFMELFNVEKLTVLGDINESFKSKIQAMKPVIKSYVGGIR